MTGPAPNWLNDLQNQASRIAGGTPGGGTGGGGGGRRGVFRRFLSKSGGVAEQMFIWGILQGVISSLFAPVANELQYLSFNVWPNVVLSPTAAADLAARGFESRDDMAAEAQKSGIDGDRFDQTVTARYAVPPLAEVFNLYNRGDIEAGSGDPREVSLHGAMAAQGIRPDWRDDLTKLHVEVPTWNDALEALLEGQLPESEAKEWYRKAGGDPDAFEFLFHTRGSAPTPTQGLDLLNRGFIPRHGQGPEATSYHQLFLEGPWRNKWEDVMVKLRRWFPSPYRINLLFSHGALDRKTSAQLLAKRGVSPELTKAILHNADTQASQHGQQLTRSAILDLYQAHIIHADDAKKMLQGLGYNEENAHYLIILANLRTSISQVNNAVTRLRTLFIDHQIGELTTKNILTDLGVPAEQIATILNTWELEAAVNVSLPTESQIRDALKYNIISQEEAMNRLEHQGYSPFDAWLLLSVTNKAPLPNRPEQGAQAVPPRRGQEINP